MKAKLSRPKTYARHIEQLLAISRKRLRLDDAYALRREYFDAIERWRWKYTELLSLAQVRHRYGLGDPCAPMLEATQDAIRLAKLWHRGHRLKDKTSPPGAKPWTEAGWNWEMLPTRVDVIDFRFGVAALLSLLVAERMSPAILAVVPSTSNWHAEVQSFNILNFPDAGLVAVLQTGKRPPKWRALLSHITRLFGRSLLEESFECYADIAIAARKRKWDRALKAVELAHELYDERSADSDWEEFEAWEGVGAGNALNIDLRLSALMRYCFRENPTVLDSLNSMHWWSLPGNVNERRDRNHQDTKGSKKS